MTTISQNICRICEKNSNNLFDVLKPQFQSLIDKYLSCANVEFDVTDNLPKYFCEICIDLLNISHNFKAQCERTYKNLLLLQQQIEIKEEIAEDGEFDQNIFDLETSETLKDELSINEIDQIENKFEVLLQPQTNIVSSKTYKCYICNKFTSKSKRSLSKHMKLKHNFKNDKNSQPKRKNSNEEHLISLKTYECYICKNFTYKSKRTLLAHMQPSHSFGNFQKKVYKCDLCDYQTTTEKRNLTRHRKVHIEDSLRPKCTCPMCGKAFAFPANMRRHINEIHTKQKLYDCNICGNKFGQFVGLQDHLATHSDERNFKCEQCEKAFKTKDRLKRHLLVHLPSDQKHKSVQHIKKYTRQICEICGKSMLDTQMYVHIRRHNGTHLQYECKICSKKFVYNQQLTYHTYTHTGERPFKCNVCPKTFRQMSHLIIHRKTHTNIRPYQCRFCEKAFTLPGNLREHERIHTGEKPYSCNLCEYRFINSQGLRKHAKNMHPEDEEAAVTIKKKGELLLK